MLVGLHVRPNNDCIYISVIIQMIEENEIFIGKNDSKKKLDLFIQITYKKNWILIPRERSFLFNDEDKIL